MEIENDTILFRKKVFDYIDESTDKLINSDYFENLMKYSVNIFLMGIYNFKIFLKEYNMFMSILITKSIDMNQMITLIETLYGINCLDNKNRHDLFEKYLTQFKNCEGYVTDNYYEKNSITYVINRLCNDYCQLITDKSFYTCVSALITTEVILNNIFNKFNLYAEKHNKSENLTYLDIYDYSSILMKILDDGGTSAEINDGITEIVKIFNTMFSELFIIFAN